MKKEPRNIKEEMKINEEFINLFSTDSKEKKHKRQIRETIDFSESEQMEIEDVNLALVDHGKEQIVNNRTENTIFGNSLPTVYLSTDSIHAHNSEENIFFNIFQDHNLNLDDVENKEIKNIRKVLNVINKMKKHNLNK
jgi:hypothetical protein